MAQSRISPERVMPRPVGQTVVGRGLGRPLKRAFFARSVHEVAPDLIGATFLVNGGGGIIVEGEAYHHNGLQLDASPIALHARASKPDIVAGPRIGITKAVELPWRYGLKGSKFLSKRF